MSPAPLRLRVSAILAVLFLAWAAAPATALDPPEKVGGEFRVNDQTSNSQFLPHVDWNENGEFAVTWTDDTNIKVRIYNSDGSSKTPEILANTTTFGTQNESQVAIGSDGRFIVIWTDYNAADGELLGVLAQRFHPDGTKLGGEFFINETLAGSQWECMVDFTAGNRMVFAWVDSIPGDGSNAGIFARIFNWDSTPVTGEFLVNDDNIPMAQVNPSLRADPNGEFVIAWQSRNPDDGSNDRVLVRRYDAAGNPLWPSRQVNVSVVGPQEAPSVVSRLDGTFAVVYTDFGGTGDGNGGGVLLRIFDRNGNPLTGEIIANETTVGTQAIGRASWDGENALFVVWNDYAGLDGSGAGVFGRAFDLNGVPLGPEIQINTFTDDNQLDCDVSMTGDGSILVIWEDQSGRDGDRSGIYGQRLVLTQPAVVPVSSAMMLVLTALALALAGALARRRS